MFSNVLRSICLVLMMLVLIAVSIALVIMSGHTLFEQYAHGEFDLMNAVTSGLALIASVAMSERAIAFDKHMGRVCGWRIMRFGRAVEKPSTKKPWEADADVENSDEVPEDIMNDLRRQRT